MIDIHIVNDGNGNVGWEVQGNLPLAEIFATYVVATKGVLKDMTLRHSKQSNCKGDCMLESDMLQVLTVLKRIETNHMKGGDNEWTTNNI